MTFDHDLSNMSVDEAKLWIYLHMDSIRDNILADQAGRLGIHSLQAAQDFDKGPAPDHRDQEGQPADG